MRSRRIRYTRRAFASLSRSVTACASGGIVAALGIIYHTKDGVNDGYNAQIPLVPADRGGVTDISDAVPDAAFAGVRGSSNSVLRFDTGQFGIVRRDIEPYRDAGEVRTGSRIKLHHQRVMSRHYMLRRRRLCA